LLCCARLRVSQANRAVIVFAMFRFVFLPTLSAVVVVFAIFRTSIRSLHHDFYKPKQEQSFHRSLRSCLTSFTHSFLHLPCPQKNYTAQQKHTPALRFQRRLSEPSLQIAHSFLISLFSVLAIPASHLRSTRYRLAPLTTASR